MKHNVSRLLSLVLALVMLVGVLPLSAREVSAEAAQTVNTMTDTLHENTFDEKLPTWNNNKTSATFEQDSTNTVDGAGSSLKLTYKDTKNPQPAFYAVQDYTIRPGNTYTMSVWFKTSDATIAPYIYCTLMNGGTSESASQTAVIEGANESWQLVTLTITATNANNTRLRAMLGCKNFAENQSVWFDNLVITETWSVENAIAAGRKNIALTGDTTVTDLTIAEGQTIDLNGYTLTADSVVGFATSALVDNSEGKSGRLACTGAVALAADNPQLPVKDANGKYLFVKPSMGASYQKMNKSDENGFQFVFRPGFGSYDGGTVKELIATGNSGVTIQLKLTQLDAWGNSNSVTIDLTEKEFDQAVYGNDTAFSATFTNPGDAQAYQSEVIVSACGVTFSSDVGGYYDNPADDNIYYYFASDFNKDATVPEQFEGRGDYTVGSKPSGYKDLTMAGTDGDRYVQVNASLGGNAGLIFSSSDVMEHSNIVFEMDVKYGSDVVNLVSGLLLYKISSGDKDLIGTNSSGDLRIRVKGESSSNTSLGKKLTSDWQTIKIEFDLANDLARVSLDGNVCGTYSIDAAVDGQFIFRKGDNTAILCMDNLKVYRYTDPNWSLK